MNWVTRGASAQRATFDGGSIERRASQLLESSLARLGRRQNRLLQSRHLYGRAPSESKVSAKSNVLLRERLTDVLLQVGHLMRTHVDTS